jgi:pyridoxal phosphate-dependent aminotransferase EpsN
VGPGDEVYCASLTFAATANPIAYLGATPVFIDSEATTWNLDPDLLDEALAAAAQRGKLPKALIAVDLYGQPAQLERIAASCRAYGVPLIEDAAEALGASSAGRPCGSFGDFSILSFNGNKIITTSGGGALLSNDGEAIAKARFLATQARDPAPHYEHSHIGYNYRMSNVCAAIGRAQLRVLGDRVAARRANFDAYRLALGELPGVDFMPQAEGTFSNRWLTCLTLDPARFGCDREAVRLALAEDNIEARPVWKPMHLQPVFRDARMVGGEVSERLFALGLCLPSGSNMSADDRDRVIAIVRRMSPTA